MARVYLSNISSQWAIQRQEALLDGAVPGWRKGPVYRDVLSQAAIKRKAALTERDGSLLRSTARQTPGQQIIVAALPVLAWTPSELVAVLLRLAARHETLRSIAEGVEIDPVSADVDAVRKAFRDATRRFSAVGVTGGQASGQKRMAEAKAKIEQIRPYWGLPSADYPTKTLCEEHGVSRPTVIQYLGSRREAQARHEASLKIAAANRRRKQHGSE